MPLAPASVALNTSVLYIGQAIGSFVGGIFYARDWLHEQGFVGAAFVAVALALVITSRPEPGARAEGRIQRYFASITTKFAAHLL